MGWLFALPGASWLGELTLGRSDWLPCHHISSPRSQLLCCLWLAGTLSGWL